MQARFARPSTGGALRVSFHSSPILPTTRSLEPPGRTLTVNVDDERRLVPLFMITGPPRGKKICPSRAFEEQRLTASPHRVTVEASDRHSHRSRGGFNRRLLAWREPAFYGRVQIGNARQASRVEHAESNDVVQPVATVPVGVLCGDG